MNTKETFDVVFKKDEYSLYSKTPYYETLYYKIYINYYYGSKIYNQLFMATMTLISYEHISLYRSHRVLEEVLHDKYRDMGAPPKHYTLADIVDSWTHP